MKPTPAEIALYALSEQFNHPIRELLHDTRLVEDLGADELDLVQLAVNIELELGRKIGDLRSLVVVQDVIDCAQRATR